MYYFFLIYDKFMFINYVNKSDFFKIVKILNN